MLNRLFKRRIYLDYASLTPIDQRVAREVLKHSSEQFANPSSLYKEGVFAKKSLSAARTSIASFIHAHSDEIVFTSSGTEANGLALEGVARAAVNSGIEKPHIIISAIEHSSILETAKMMENHGCEVTRVPVNVSGVVSIEEIKDAIKPNTILVSIMTVNNETGAIQPIREIAKVIRQAKKALNKAESHYPLFHTDAAQAVLYQELFVEKLGVDLLTLDGSKAYGPRGIGCLYVKRDTPIEAIVRGGGQERGLRSSTENIPGIMGFAKALEIAAAERGSTETDKNTEVERIGELREMMVSGLKSIRSDISVNGEGAEVSPHILNVSIPGIDNEFFLFQLDARGIACSTKSSCLRDEDESYVLKAMGADTKSSMRFSFGRWTKKNDIRAALKAIGEILSK
ncbi:MAG: hypothetical protein RLY66_456 [Candidatus Parcubacteria bacterium]|jgi:cysteine desulfurase